MTSRIGEYVLSGELRNTIKNSVVGWIEFAPDYGIRIELTGNLSGALAGKQLRFKVARSDGAPPVDPVDLPDAVNDLADRQIGVVGEMQFRKVRVPDLPIDDFLDLPQRERAAHIVEKDALYLEWYSQNGRVLAEIIEPSVKVVDETVDANDEDLGAESSNPGQDMGFTEIRIDEDGVAQAEYFGNADEEEEDEADDPYGLFGSDLEQRVAEALGGPPADESDADADDNRGVHWRDSSADLDPETRAMYEQWDEIFEGKKDQPISYLFDQTLRLPQPDKVASDEEAKPLVRAILAQLAKLSVALDVCEHFSSLETYRVLLKEILPTARVHPDLAASEMVQHYSTSDFCDACEAELESEFDDDPEDQHDEES